VETYLFFPFLPKKVRDKLFGKIIEYKKKKKDLTLTLS
jgi:hypothetical protein